MRSYWRQFGSVFHCFDRKIDGVYTSMCSKFKLKKVGGTKTNRPPADRRCPRCKFMEVMKTEAKEPIPASPDFSPY